MRQHSPETLSIAVATRLYGYRPTRGVRLDSENNDVFRVDFGGLPAKVVKLARRVKPVLHEQKVLRLLGRPRWGLPCPKLEFTQADLPGVWSNAGQDWQRPTAVSVMRHEAGMSLRDAALRGEPWAGDAFRAAGALLARLAEVPATQMPHQRRTLTAGQIRRGIESVAAAADQFGFEAAAFDRWRAYMTEIRGRAARSIVHGEPYAEQFLVRPGDGGVELTLLDWETARPGAPLADLATLLASFELHPGPDAGEVAALQRRAMDGFCATRPLDDDGCTTLAAWRVHVALHGARFAAQHDAAAARRLVRTAINHWTRAR